MEQYMVEEIELNLLDLFWTLLKRWRILLISALAAMVLMGIIGYLRSGNDATVGDAVKKAELMEALTAEDQLAVQEIEGLAAYQEWLEADVARDPLMKMSSSRIYERSAQLYVSADDIISEGGTVIRTFAEDLQAAYSAYIAGSEMREGLAAVSGEISADKVLNYILIEPVGFSSINIIVMYNRDDVCTKMMQYIIQALQEHSAVFEEQIGPHTLNVVAQDAKVGYSSTVHAKQVERYTTLSTARSNLKKAERNLTAEQRAVYSYVVSDAENVSEATPRRIDFKYVIVGFLLGGFLACAWFAVCYVTDGKLKTVEDAKKLVGGYIGTIAVNKRAKSRFLGIVDVWIERLQYGKNTRLKTKKQIGIISANVELLCKNHGVDKLYITDTISNGSVAALLAEYLQKKDIQVEVGPSILTDAASLQQMADCDAVLLWAQLGASRYADMAAIKNLCCTQQVKVLGAVLVV